MRLGGSGKQLLQKCIVNLEGGGDHGLGARMDLRIEIRLRERVQDQLEDLRHGRVRELGEREEREVAQEAVGHDLSAAARRPHGAHHRHVDDLVPLDQLSVPPAAMAEPEAQDLNGRLRAVRLAQGHVDVVNEDDVLLARGRAVDALAPLVELGIEHVLRLVGARLRREAHLDGLVLVGHAAHELIEHRKGLARAGRSNAEHVEVMEREALEHRHVAHRVESGHDDVRKGRGRLELELGDGGHPADPFVRHHVDRVVEDQPVLGHLDLVSVARLDEQLAEAGIELEARGAVRGGAAAPDDGEGDELLEALAQLRLEPIGQLVHAVDRDELRPERVQHVERRGGQVVLDGSDVLLRTLAAELVHRVDERLEHRVEGLLERHRHLGQGEDPRVDLRDRAYHLLWLHEDGAHTAHSCGRGDGEVLDLEDHVHVRRHRDDLARDEAELLVVVEHRVHRLDPDGVDGAVEDDPLPIGLPKLAKLLDGLPVQDAEHAVRPLVRVLVELAIELAHRDRLRVEDVPLDGRVLAVLARAV